MNQADNARRYNEIKTLIDRTLPLVEHGKGCTVIDFIYFFLILYRLTKIHFFDVLN